MTGAAEFRRPAGRGHERPDGSDTPPPADLAFALRFEAGKGLLTLVHAPGPAVVVFEALDLEIPDLRFPFDVTGGAARFKTHRLRLRDAVLRVDLDLLAAGISSRLRASGVRRVELDERCAIVTMGDGAVLASDLLVEPSATSPRNLEVLVSRARAVGPIGAPATMAARRLVQVALGDERILSDPLRAALKATLCARGWRLPDLSGVRLASAARDPSRSVRLAFSVSDAGSIEAPITQAGVTRLEGLRLCKAADASLSSGDLEGARRAIVDALARDPDEPELALRLAEIDAVDPARAEGALSSCAELVPSEEDLPRLHAIRAAAHAALGQSLEAADALEALAGAEKDPRMRSAALWWAATSCLAERPERAYGHLWTVERLRRGDSEVTDRLYELALGLGRRADLKRLLPRVLANQSEARLRAATLARLGRTFLERFADPSEARAALERALRIDPGCEEALETLAGATARLGQAPKAVRVLGRLADLRQAAGDRAGAARAHLAAGRALLEDLGDPIHAAARLREAVTLEPDLAAAQALYGRACASLGRAEDAARALARFVELSTGAPEGPLAGTSDALILLARIHLDERSAPEEALDAARMALAVRPRDSRALRLIEQALFVRKDWLALADHHLWAAGTEPDRAHLHLRERARILEEHLDDPVAALATLASASDRAPDDLAVHEGLARLASRLGDDAALRGALERLARLRPSPDGRADAFCALAELFVALADPRAATAALIAAAETAPTHPIAAERLVEVRRRIGEPIALGRSLCRFAEILEGRGEGARAHEALIEAGRALSRGGRWDEASLALRRGLALASRAGRPATLLLVAEVEERRGAWPEARLAYAELHRTGHGSAASALAEARVAAHLGDDEGARSLLGAVLEGDGASVRERDLALERLIELHRRRGDHRAEADALERAGLFADDQVHGGDLLCASARIHVERLEDPAGAERILWALASRTPRHEEGLALLTHLCEARGDPSPLARVYELRAESARDPGGRIEALAALGALYTGALRDDRRAERAYRLLLAESGDNEAALSFLARLEFQRGALELAEAHYSALASRARSAATRADAAVRMGALRRDAGDAIAAERWLCEALEQGQDPAQVLPALEEVLSELGKHADQAKVIERRLAVAPAADAPELLRRLADLYEARLGDPQRAIPVLSRLALLEPSNVEVLLRLARVAKDGGDATGEADALHRAAALTPDDALAAERLADAAEALWGLAGHEERVVALLEEALDRDPANARSARLADSRLAAAGDHAGRARLFERVAAAATEPGQRADALLRCAEIELDALANPRDLRGNPDGAMQHALAAAGARPAASADLVARIARKIGDPIRETAALAALLEHSDDRAARPQIHRRLAELLLGPLAEPRGAETHLRAILALEPEDLQARETLERILEERGDGEALARLLLSRAELLEASGGDPGPIIERAARSLESAAEAAASRGDTELAIRLAEEAMGLEPIRARLDYCTPASWARRGPRDSAADRLDALYAASGRHEDRLALLQRRADGLGPEEARGLLSRLGGALPEPLAAALDERLADLGDADARARWVDRLRAAGQKDAVVTILARAAMEAEPGPVRIAALLTVADAALDAGDASALEDALREAVLEDPTAAVPVDRLAAFLEEQDRLDLAIEVLAQAELVCSDSVRLASLLSRRASLLGRLGEDDAAILALERAMPLCAGDPEIDAQLEAAYRRAGRWTQLTALLASRLEDLPPSTARLELALQIGQILEERLSDLAGAARMYLQAALGSPPGEPAALAATRAYETAQRAGDGSLAADALLARADAMPFVTEPAAGADQAALESLVLRSAILRKQGREREAAESLEEALRRDPDHGPVLMALGTLRQSAGKWSDARALFERLLQGAPSNPADVLAATRAVAQCSEALGDVDEAARACERLVQLAPSDPEPLLALARLAEGRGRWADAVRALDAVLPLSTEPPDRLFALVRRGKLLEERLGEAAKAARDFLAAAELEPSVPADSSDPRRERDLAERALALAVQEESWRDAVRAARILIERTDDPVRKKELLVSRARLEAQRLGDPSAAADDLIAALGSTRGPADRELLAMLAGCALSAGRIEIALEAMERLLASLDEPRSEGVPATLPIGVDLAGLCLRAAEAAEQAVRPEAARRLYRRAIDLGIRSPEQVAARLIRLLDPKMDQAELGRMLEIQLAAQTLNSEAGVEARAAVLRKLASLALEAGDDDGATRHLQALVEIAPRDPLAFGNLRRIYQRKGAWQALRDLLGARVALGLETSETVALLHEAGRLAQEKLGDEDEAMARYREALVLDPEHLPALDALADLCFRRAEIAEADALYGRLGLRGMLPLDTLLLRRAECAERQGRIGESMAHYRAAIANNPKNARASEALARLLVIGGDVDEAARELGRAVELCPENEPERAAGLRVLLGETLMKAGRFADAEAPLRFACHVLSDDAQPLLFLRDTYQQLERWSDLADVLGRLGQLVTTPRARAEIEFRIGEVQRLRLRDPARAADHYRRAYDVDPRHLPTLRRLVVQYAEEGDARSAAEIFGEIFRLDAAAPRHAPVLHAVARIADHLVDPAPTLALLEEAVRRAGSDPAPALALARAIASLDPPRAIDLVTMARSCGAPPEEVERLGLELSGDPRASRVAASIASGVLETSPADPAALAMMAMQADRSGNRDAAHRARAILAFVDPAAPRVQPPRGRVLSEDEREAILGGLSLASTPLAVAVRHARHAFRPSAGETTVPGLPIGDAGPSEIAEPLAQARLLVGGLEVETYLLDDPSPALTMQNGEQPRLLFGGSFGSLPEAERVFSTARALCRLRTGEGLLDGVGPEEILSRLKLLRRALVGARIDDPAREVLERSAASMSPRERLIVAQSLDRGLEGTTAEQVAEVLTALRLAAGRIALSATRDITTALTAILRAECCWQLRDGPALRAEAVRSSVALRDLATFALDADPLAVG